MTRAGFGELLRETGRGAGVRAGDRRERAQVRQLGQDVDRVGIAPLHVVHDEGPIGTEPRQDPLRDGSGLADEIEGRRNDA